MAAFAELLNPVHSPEKTKILEAIATHGPRIVPVEVAASTGMALPAVMAELNTIASETNAHLEVTEKGNIAYLFQPNLAQAYTANAGREIFRSIGRVLANVSIIVLRAFCALMFFLVRISFGLALILGFVFIVVLVVVVVIALLKGMDSDSGGGGDGGGFDFDFGSLFDFGWGGGYYSRPFYMYWLWDWIWDWFFFWRYVSPDERYYNEPVSSYDAGYGKVGEEKEKKSNFLMNVFSYLFGDGDPNKNFEELEWQTLAQVIESNQGVVTAEMLAPYAGEDPKDEDWMVHVLQRYNGIPEVTEAGGIVYTFPAFQIQGLPASGGAGGAVNFDPAAPVNQDQMSGADLNNLYRNHLKRQTVSKTSETKKLHIDRALTKKTWNFMSVDGGSLTAIIMFGLTILTGSAFILAHSMALYGIATFIPAAVTAHVIIPAVWAAFTYGLLFFLVPGVRYAVYKMINDGIEASNTAKLEYAAQLANPSPELAKKLDDARVIRIGGMASGPDKTVYTTEKDAIDQETDDDYRLPPSH
ncbi:MAG: hypothetical protein KGS72_16985 [Cyanobacteria bacterium REEB67]|nr:hypothetical protein [Cyanobacteria bacterium REEB67]